MKILITNAEYKHTLAAVRSLGKRGIEVTAASNAKHALTFYSKYCKASTIYTSPSNESLFIKDIKRIVIEGKFDVLLPIGFTVCMAIAKHKAELDQYVRIPIASYESMRIASDKNETIKFAAKINIPHPKTIYPDSLRDVIAISEEIEYPVVIKAPEESGSVKYANSAEELLKLYNQVCNAHKGQVDRGKFPQIQEYIKGDGYGFFALFNQGEPRAIFAHKRLHEYPPTGGPSTMAQSFYDPALQDLGIRILKNLNWHGVAMVEFKKDIETNEFKLIEINPKFWGSLGLAIASGVDFPYLASKMCIDGDIEPLFDYDKNMIYRWVLPDLIYSLASNSLTDYIRNSFNNKITTDFYLDDIKPAIFESYCTMFEVVSRIKNRSLKSPHGQPKVTL